MPSGVITWPVRLALPPVFRSLPTRDLNQGTLRVGAVHGFGVVAQSFLREAFGVAGRLGALSPGVAVAVECHAQDLQLVATLLELHGTVPGPDVFCGQLSF